MFKLPPGNYCSYLRKSRADLEAEASGEEDTYKRHDRILLDLAKRYGIVIKETYREKPISGERISERPEMIRLLEDVEEEKWDGVFTVEVERLARGDTMDQGLVAQTFKYSQTLIVTPMRIFNPDDPNDEEYFEFNLFMSRREFKTINRRLQGGRISAVEEGRYIGSVAPYGYVKYKLPGKGFSLKPHPEQAPIVQLIFSLYTDPDPEKRMGTTSIADYLNNELKVPTARDAQWTEGTLNNMLRNPTYLGNVRWGFRPVVKKKNSKSRPRRSRKDSNEHKGLHVPLIDLETFELAWKIRESNSNSKGPKAQISNPLAGIVRCGMCGGPILYRPFGGKSPDALICTQKGCPNVSSYLHLVEERLVQSLGIWLNGLKSQLNTQRDTQPNRQEDAKINALLSVQRELKKQLEEVKKQQNNIHDYLEQQVYTIEMFKERSKILVERYEEIKKAFDETEAELASLRRRVEAQYETIPKLEKCIDGYQMAKTPEEKNALLKQVIESVIYTKKVGGRWSGAIDQFDLKIVPKISAKKTP
ncbi:recombinase family protein [Paenibacillus elgii]|uniref:recombinase family protein n=1 Tax=Paenibacillus elgii TaxID=189691 RepID=UPI000248D7C1|nr:recombinase family protein [Paenibacillus elgii]